MSSTETSVVVTKQDTDGPDDTTAKGFRIAGLGFRLVFVMKHDGSADATANCVCVWVSLWVSLSRNHVVPATNASSESVGGYGV